MESGKPKSKRGGARPGAGRKPKNPDAPKAAKPKRKSPSKAKRKGEKTPAEKAHETLMAMTPDDGAPIHVSTEAEQGAVAKPQGHRWQKGESGNPAGRKKGSRNKLGEAFIADFYADWLEHGVSVLATVRNERPQDYLKAAVAILPKQLDVRVSEFEEMTDDELDQRIRQLAARVEIAISAPTERAETTH